MKLINWSDTNETAAVSSVASEDAVAQGDDDDSRRKIGRTTDYTSTDPQREEGTVREKRDEKPQGQESAESRTNKKNNCRLILAMVTGMLILLLTFLTIKFMRKENVTIPATAKEDPFDFADIRAADNPTTSTSKKPSTSTSTEKPSTSPSIASFDFDFEQPSTKPSTSSFDFDFEQISNNPSTSSFDFDFGQISNAPSTQEPTESPSKSPSLVPSTPPPTVSHAPSDYPSSTPTYNPTQSVEPFARPPVLPFREKDSDSVLTFCVIADAPYSEKEAEELPGQIATQMEGCEFLVHLGDIFLGGSPCRIEDYESIQNIMLESHAPAFVVPGDNEWNDCPRHNIDIGWDHWTDHFLGFEDNWNHTFSIMRQPGYEENFYFIEKRILLFGLNIVGGRVHDKLEWKTRLRSEFLWVKDLMLKNLVAKKTADSVILMAHADPSKSHREFFNAFRVFLRDELKNEFPVLYLHGDGHRFLYTPNFHNQPNFLRIQHEGGTHEPVLKIMAGNRNGRSSVYDVFQYDRQLELMANQERD